MAAETKSLQLRGNRWIPGAGMGVVAFALGYLVTYVQASRFAAPISEGFLGDATAYQPPVETVIGWFFLNAHFVSLGHGGSVWGLGNSINYITMMEGTSPLLFLVPPVLLGVAGVSIGFLRSTDDVRDALWTGASLVPGYLAATIVLGFVATVEYSTTMGTSGGTGITGPHPPAAILLVGVFYPFVFGSLGAGLAVFVAKRDS